MPLCPTCTTPVASSDRFCPACGTGLADARPVAGPTALTTLVGAGDATTATAPAGSGPSSTSLDLGAFVPGTMVEGRYRIVGLLGRGGMGEVYRADDLKLGQPVALKFLPAGLERDPGRLQRFLNEVRTARQVTHPNVCRVYDIGEVDGQHYISMEYVDGEDLASLLRRIGRLPQEQAVEMARQICAGLAAAHDQGILHRDLKPANVMLDGRGRVRLTDFGLAGLAAEIAGADVTRGTPAYMAPEQLAGREVTVRSDIYALGLVLYELFTGRQAFAADTVAELQRLQTDSAPSSLSSHVRDLDPAVERAMLRCLEKDAGGPAGLGAGGVGGAAGRRSAGRGPGRGRDAVARTGGPGGRARGHGRRARPAAGRCRAGAAGGGHALGRQPDRAELPAPGQAARGDGRPGPRDDRRLGLHRTRVRRSGGRRLGHARLERHHPGGGRGRQLGRPLGRARGVAPTRRLSGTGSRRATCCRTPTRRPSSSGDPCS